MIAGTTVVIIVGRRFVLIRAELRRVDRIQRGGKEEDIYPPSQIKTIRYFQWDWIMAWVETRTMTKRLRFVQVKCYMYPFVYTIVPCWLINFTAMVLSPSMEAFLLLSLQQAPTSSIVIIFVTQNLVDTCEALIDRKRQPEDTVKGVQSPVTLLAQSSQSWEGQLPHKEILTFLKIYPYRLLTPESQLELDPKFARQWNTVSDTREEKNIQSYISMLYV